MAQNTEENLKDFISLSEASKATGYHSDYLSFLCRTGKLKGFKIGRNWVTTETGLDEFLKNFKNGIKEVTDEQGHKIPVHVESTQSVARPFMGNEEEGVADKLARYNGTAIEQAPQQVLGLTGLKKEVFQGIESRIENISESLGSIEKRLDEDLKKQKKDAGAVATAVVAGAGLEAIQRGALRRGESFASNFAFGTNLEKNAEATAAAEGVLNGVSDKSAYQSALGSQRVKQLYQSFIKPQKNNVPLLIATALVALTGLVGSFLWNSFAGQPNGNSNLTKIVYSRQSSSAANNSPSGSVVLSPSSPDDTKIVNQLLGLNQSQVYSLIDSRLDQYLSEGKFRGQPGSAGQQGPQGPTGTGASFIGGPAAPVTYVTYNNGNGTTGSIGSFTQLSAQDFSSDQADINTLNIQGNSTFNGPAEFNGTTTISNLELSNITGMVQCLHVDANGNISGSGVDCGVGGSGAGGSGGVATGTPGAFAFYPAATPSVSPQTLLFISGNNLGVGTSAPSSEFTIQATGSPTNLFSIASTSGSTLLTVTSNGNFGIGTSSPSSALSVVGSALLTGNENLLGQLSVGGSTILATATVSNLTVGGLSVFATTTVSSLTISGATTINGITYNWPSSQAANTFLETDGNGNLIWNTTGGGGAASSTGAAGDIQLAGATGNLNADALFSYSASLHRLSLGTTSTSSSFTLQGQPGTVALLTIASSSGTSLFQVAANGSTTIASLNQNLPVFSTAGGSLYNSTIPNAVLENSSINVSTSTGITGGGLVSLGGTVNIGLATTGTPGTYGSSSQVPVFTTNQFGQITGVTNTDLIVPTSSVSGVLGYPNGGTGQTSYTTNGVIFAGPSSLQSTGAGTVYQILTSDGSGSAPAYADIGSLLTGGSNINITGTSTVGVVASPSFTNEILSGTLSVIGTSTLATTSVTSLTVNGDSISGSNSGDVTLTGQNYLTLSGQQITANLINLGANVTGVLPSANGGTGTTTLGSLTVGSGLSISGGQNVLVGTSTQITLSNNVISNVSTGTSGTIFNISTSTNSLTINLPFSSISNTGQLLASDWANFNNKLSGSLSANQVVYATAASSTAGSNNFIFNPTSNTLAITGSTTISNLVTVGGTLAVTGTSTLATTTITNLTLGQPLAITSGGLGTSTTPTLNQILIGNASGGYNLVATSSLGFASASSFSGTNGQVAYFTSGSNITSASDFLNNATVVGVNATSSTVSFNVQGSGTLNPFNVASSSGVSELFVGSNGNVGIGTTSPVAKLDVWGNLNVGTSSTPTLFVNSATGQLGVNTNSFLAANTAFQVNINSALANPAGINLNNLSTGGTGIQLSNSNLAQSSAFQVFISNDNPPKFKIGQNNVGDFLTILPTTGLVGIGTTNPQKDLHVNDAVAGPKIYVSSVAPAIALGDNSTFSSASAYAVFGLSSSPGSYVNNSVAGDVALTSSGGAILFGTNGTQSVAATERVRITNAGNVGIGTSSPSSLLQVAGAETLGAAGTTAGQLIFQNAANAQTVTLKASTTATSYSLALPTVLGASSTLLTTDANGNLSFVSTSTLGFASASNVVTTLATGTTGSIFNGSILGNTLTLNLPFSSISSTGQLLASDWATFNNKLSGSLSANQVVYATAASSTAGSNNFIFNPTSNTLAITGSTTISNLLTVGGTLAVTGQTTLANASTTNLSASGIFNVTGTSTLATTTITNLTLSQPLGLPSGGLGFNASSVAKGGIIVGTGSGTLGIQTVGADNLCLVASSTAASGLTWTSCASASGAITSLNGLTASSQTFATGTDANIGLTITSSGSVHTFTPTFTGQLSVSRGGTGQSTLTTNALLFGNGTSGIGTTTLGTNGQILVGVTGSAPTFVTVSSDASINNSGALTLATVNSNVGTFGASNQTLTATVNAKGLVTSISTSTIAIDASQINSGILAIARGGTNTNTTPTAGGVTYGTGSAYAFTSAGTAFQILQSNGSSAPTFSNIGSLLTAGSNIVITGTSTIAVSASPSFTSLTLTNPLALTSGGIGTTTLGNLTVGSGLSIAGGQQVLIGTSTQITLGNNVITNISTGTTGSIFNISTTTNSLTINLPFASSVNTGQLQSGDWTTFNNKLSGNLAANQIVFATAASSTAGSNLFTFTTGSGLVVGATSTLATTTISQLSLGNGLTSTILAVDQNGKIIATTTSAGGVTSVSGSGSILSSGGTTPTIQLQNLAANDILFGQGNNTIGTSTSFTFNSTSNTLAVTGSTTISNLLTVGGTLAVTGTSTLATTTISQLKLGDGIASTFLAADANGNVIATTSPSGCSLGGTSSTQVLFNNAGSCAGNAAFTWDNTNNGLTLLGGGNIPPLTINNVTTAADLDSLSISLSVTASSTGGQQETIPLTVTSSGSAAPGTFSGLYTILNDNSSTGTITHALGVVSRMQLSNAGNVSVMSPYYGDSTITGTGTVSTLATFADFNRNIGAGTNVINSVGIVVGGSSGAGTVTNDFGMTIPDFTTAGKGSNTNVGLSIGGQASGVTAALDVLNGQSLFNGKIVNNIFPPANADLANISQQDIAGASTGVTRGVDSVLLTSMSPGQTNAGLTGARFTVYNGASGTTTNEIAIEAVPSSGNQTGGVTNLYGLKVDDAGGNALINNSYGIYIGNQRSGGGTYTNVPYSIYSSDASAYTYLAGNLGIGTSTPGQKLVVGGNMQLTGALFDSTNASGTQGNVLISTGIGTQWVATSTLGISGGSGVTGGTNGKVAVFTSATTLSTGDLLDNLSVSGVNATSSTVNFNIQGTGNLNPFNVASSSGASEFIVTSAGNIGIGTTAPAALLQVSSTAGASSQIVYGGAPINQFSTDSQSIINSSANAFAELNTSSGRGIGLGGVIEDTTTNSAYAVLGFANSKSTSGTRDNLVGVGGEAFNEASGTITNLIGTYGFGLSTASGSIANIYSLMAFENSNPGGAQVTNNYGLYVQNQNISGANNYEIYAAGASPFAVTGAGNVGIGTATPAQLLTVAGNEQLTGALFDSTNASGTLGQILETIGTGTQWVATSTLGLQAVGNYITNSYASSTFPSFTYASSTYQIAGTYVTSVSGSGSILSSGGTTPTIQLQNLTANDILFGQGNNTFATSSNFTFSSSSNTLAVTGSTTISNLLTVGGTLAVTGTSTLATTTISQLSLGNGLTSALLAVDQNGKVIATTAPSSLTGGTNGKVAVFTSATTLGTGDLLDNLTVSGVNATSSTVNFNVQGTGNLNPFNVASSSGSSELFVASSGNVGIGTSSPQAQLHVVASSAGNVGEILGAASGQTADLLQLQDNSGNVLTQFDASGNENNLGYSNSPYGGTGVYGNLLQYSEQFENVWTTSNLTVTTGATTSPDTSATGERLSDSSSGGFISQATVPVASSTYTFAVWLKASSTVSAALRIDGSGSGTGTAKTVTVTTAWQRFTITQNVGTFTGNVTPKIFPGGTGGTNTVFAWGASLNAGSTPYVYIKTFNPIFGSPIGNFSPATANGTVVNGSFYVAANVVQTGNVAEFYGENCGTTCGIQITGQYGAKLALASLGNTYGTGDISVGIDSPNVMEFTSVFGYYFDDNIGVATKTPGSDLTLQGTSGQTKTFVNIASSSGTSYLTVTANGNLGLGTTTPLQVLTVAGNMQLTGALFDSTNASGTLGMVLQSTGTSTIWVATSTLGISGGSGVTGGTNGKVAVFTSATTLGTGDLLDNLTVSGVNATSSTVNFNIQGTGNLNPFNVASSSGISILAVTANQRVGIGSTTPNATLVVEGTSTSPTLDVFQAASSSNAVLFDVTASGKVGIGTTAPGSLLMVQGQSGSVGQLFDVASSSGTSYLHVTSAGNVGIGSSSPVAALVVQGSTSGNGANAVGGILASTTLAQTTASGFEYGDRFLNNIAGTASGTFDGLLVRTSDSMSNATNTVRGIEVDADSGNNTLGVNSGITAFGKTFGVQGITSGLAGGIAQPAGVYAELDNTTVGNAFRAYSNQITSANLTSLFQESSAFTGDGLLMNFGNNGGSFSGNFEEDQVAGATKLKVNSAGNIFATLRVSTNGFALCHETNGAGLDEIKDCGATPAADYQEIYPVSTDVEIGDVLVAGSNFATTTENDQVAVLVKATKPYQQFILGVASDPAISNDFNSIGHNLASTTPQYPIALKGRVKVKVTNENGSISVGDYLTSSAEFPGYAMKATRSGDVIGQALENFAPAATSTIATSTVLTFVQTGFENINNTFVLGEDDGQLSNATSTEGVAQASSSQASTFLINQVGSGNLLQLQQNGEDRFLVANDGSINILASTTLATSTVLSVQNGTTSLFSINAVGDVNTLGHISVGQDTAGTATILAGDNQAVVTFNIPYDSVPKIAVTMQGLPNFFYGVATKTPTGFTIQTSQPVTADTSFDWIALAQPTTTPSQSSLNLSVVTQPSNPGQISPPASSGGSGDDSGSSGDATGTEQVLGTSTSTPDSAAPSPTPEVPDSGGSGSTVQPPPDNSSPPADSASAGDSGQSAGN